MVLAIAVCFSERRSRRRKLSAQTVTIGTGFLGDGKLTTELGQFCFGLDSGFAGGFKRSTQCIEFTVASFELATKPLHVSAELPMSRASPIEVNL